MNKENKVEKTESGKPFSFGELLKQQAEENKNNIPDDLFEIHDEPQPQETVAPEETQTTPQPQQNIPTQQTSSPPQPPTNPPAQTQTPQQPVSPPEPKVVEKIVEKIVEKPIVDEEEVRRLYEQRIQERQKEIRERGRQVKAQKRDNRIDKIISFAQAKQSFDNQDIRDLLHISQSAATVYLSELVNKGQLIREGKSKYIKYHRP